MKKKVLVTMIILSLICACNSINASKYSPSQSVVSNPTTTQTVQKKITPTITKIQPTSTMTYPLAVATTSPTAENNRISPIIMQVCPDSREVPFDQLGIPAEHLLIVEPTDPTKKGYWTISGSEVISEVIPYTDDPNWMYRLDGISPNGEWILYDRGPQNSFDSVLWISSIDGSRRWEIGPNDTRNYAGWSSNEQIIIGGKPNERKYYTPTSKINPFTIESVLLPPLPETSIGLLNIILNDDISYRIYYDEYHNNKISNEQFAIYDYYTDTMVTVLRWLKDSGINFDDPFNLYYRMRLFQTQDDMISGVVNTSYGIDLMDELSLSRISESLKYQDVMTPILLPGEGPDTQITWISYAKPLMALDRLKYRQAEPKLSKFYTFDYQSMTLTDYCLDRGNYEPISYTSTDERYLAWTEDDLATGRLKETVILDLKTGYLSRINGVVVLGWGVMNEK